MIRTMFAAAAAVSLSGIAAYAEPAVVMAPGGAGGGYDATARLPFEAMAADGIFSDGATFTNKGGAGGTIGLAEFVSGNQGNDNAVMSMGVDPGSGSSTSCWVGESILASRTWRAAGATTPTNTMAGRARTPLPWREKGA